jgi:hypothetical protein
MLEFSDEAFARLCVAATAVPRRRRGGWLRRLAAAAENKNGKPADADPAVEARRRRDRERQRRRRKREKAHFRLAVVEIGPPEEERPLSA